MNSNKNIQLITCAGILIVTLLIIIYKIYFEKSIYNSTREPTKQFLSIQGKLEMEIDKLSRSLKKDQKNYSTILQEIIVNQSKFREELVTFQNQISMLSNKTSQQITAMPSNKEQPQELTGMDTDLQGAYYQGVNYQDKNNNDNGISDLTVEQYLDNVLITSDMSNTGQTEIAKQKTNKILMDNNILEITLEAMDCGKGFCRAKFSRIDGEVPDLDFLLGNAPFTTEGMIIPNNDGSVFIYFTEDGVSIESLKKPTKQPG